MPGGIVDKSIDLDELLKKEAGKGSQGDSFKQRLSDAYAMIFNTLQELKEIKAKGDFGALKQAKSEVYEEAMKCKITSDELKDFLDFLGESDGAGEGSQRRRYRR